MRLGLVFLAAACLLAMSATTLLAAGEQQLRYGTDDFESYTVGDSVPLYITYPDVADWNTWSGTAATNDYTAIESEGVGNQVAHVYDNGGGTGTTQFRTNFYPERRTTGIWGVSMDINPLQTDGPFKIVMTRWDGWTTGNADWCAAVGFDSSAGTTWWQSPANGTGQAHLLLETTQTTQTWVDTGVSYSANTWYTVEFFMDVDAQKYKCWFGERGGSLTQLTNGWTAWMCNKSTGQIMATTFGGVLMATSNKTGEDVEFLVDNVNGYVPEPGSLVAMISLLGLIPAMKLRRR
jgi:hypothetical protein